MIAADEAIGFRGTLGGLEVVGDRDHRKEDQQKDRQGDELHAPISAGARGKTNPQADHHGCQDCPSEI